MLVIMNFLIAMVFFMGAAMVKSSWSDKKYIKAIGFAIMTIVVCFVLLFMKESMKATNRSSALSFLF
jgi:hypothetical protein